jgi:3-dehydroquinate dehydratase/shikimate dehydrogenase
MSPAILNDAFSQAGVDAVYLPFRVEPDYGSFAAFIDACVRRPWFGLRGCSVTIPHKENLLRYVEQRGGYIEPLAKRIGAANTLVIEPGKCDDGSVIKDDRLEAGPTKVGAYNTDYRGAMDALLAGMGRTREQMAGASVAVIGAGGVSRAIVAGLRDSGCEVTIYNRTHAKAEALAAEFGAKALPYEDRIRHGAKVVINCTSIGMFPHTDETPMPAEGLAGKPLVFDTVYNPIETRLLREAREIGCQTVDGVAMFIGQAAAQFERWTGRPAPCDIMREVVIEKLGKPTSEPQKRDGAK